MPERSAEHGGSRVGYHYVMAASRSVAPQGQGPRSDVQQQVVEWRESVLVQAGCSQEVAERIALSDADLHAACDLLASGCSPELAERILV